MKVRKVIVVTLIFTLLCGSAVYADSVASTFRLWVNNKEVDDGGVIVDGKSYGSLKGLTEKLHAMLVRDDNTKKMTIFNPNVHMFVLDADSAVFGDVTKGKYKFSVFSQVDSLRVDISAYKITITNPYGDETLVELLSDGDKRFPDKGKKDFWSRSKEITYNFDMVGEYVLRFWMRPDGESGMQVVSEKIINSK